VQPSEAAGPDRLAGCAVAGVEAALESHLEDGAGLLDLTQGRAAGPFERSIDVLISRIRQKIERDTRNPEFIRTIRSGGYLFTPEVTRS